MLKYGLDLVLQVIIHKDSVKEGKDLWKGNDFALLKLGSYGNQWRKLSKRGMNKYFISSPQMILEFHKSKFFTNIWMNIL